MKIVNTILDSLRRRRVILYTTAIKEHAPLMWAELQEEARARHLTVTKALMMHMKNRGIIEDVSVGENMVRRGCYPEIVNVTNYNVYVYEGKEKEYLELMGITPEY